MEKPSGGWETSRVRTKIRRDKYCDTRIEVEGENYGNN
jgi:hypothetical protein